MSAFFYVYLLLHYFGQSEKYKVLTLVSMTRRIPGCSSFIFGCKYSPHCTGITRWASRALQLGGVESRLPDVRFNIPIINKHKFQLTAVKKNH